MTGLRTVLLLYHSTNPAAFDVPDPSGIFRQCAGLFSEYFPNIIDIYPFKLCNFHIFTVISNAREKNMTKKYSVFTILSLFLIGCLAAGCGISSMPDPESQTDASTEVTAQTAAAADEEPQEEEPDPRISVLTGQAIDPELGKQRPIAVMYPIDRKAQPQYGLNKVDVFYEIIEEGRMSRQMGIIQDWKGLDRIGNIRSTRPYFVRASMEWDSILVHYGGPEDFVAPLTTRDDVDNINGVGGRMGSDYGAFFRIPAGSLSEHTAYTDADHLLAAIDRAGYSLTHRDGYYNKKHFTFAQDGSQNDLSQYNDAVDCTDIDMAGCFPVTRSKMTYNAEDGLYYRSIYGAPQCDGATGEQMAFTNVLIQDAECHNVGNHGYLDFTQITDGTDGWFCTGGKMIHVSWSRADDWSPTVFYDDNGEEITLNPGKTMIFIIEENSQDSFTVNGTTYHS